MWVVCSPGDYKENLYIDYQFETRDEAVEHLGNRFKERLSRAQMPDHVSFYTSQGIYLAELPATPLPEGKYGQPLGLGQYCVSTEQRNAWIVDRFPELTYNCSEESTPECKARQRRSDLIADHPDLAAYYATLQ